MKKGEPAGGNIFSLPFIFWTVIALIGAFFLARRFMYGIGAVSNMNDGYPWGIWIVYDVVVGTAFGCGGFAMALLIYVFNKNEFHRLLRPALLASVLGYSLAAVAVFIDVGRYWQMYNLFLPWYANTASVLLEVALCIGAYCVVLWIEFSPVLLEKFKASKLRAVVNKTMFFFIALGILLPTMHQSSLGSLMIAAGQKLNPLWWTPMLPLLYLISAVIMGYSFVLFEASVTTLRTKEKGESRLLAKLSTVFTVLIAVFLVIRLGDVIYRGQLGRAFNGDLMGNLFLLENLLLAIPMVVLAFPNQRQSARARFFSALALIISGVLLRFDTYIVGFHPGNGWTYFPSSPEIMISAGIFGFEMMVYLWFIRRLPVFHRA